METHQNSNGNWPWWLRYGLALGIIWATWHIFSDMHPVSDGAGLLGIGAYLIAAFMMYEIFFALILGGLVWAFFGVVAGLPTSVAVIIGALIIANSNKK